ncbi:MAG TPA: Dabb family protein [Verrucomicrobiae bacterium]
MKRTLLLLLTLLIASVALSAAADTLQHVVCFKFKSTATPADIQRVEDSFRNLKQQIPQVLTFQCGTNVSLENLNKGFTHCFTLTFKSAEDRDIYLKHPAHKAFGKVVGPVMADVFVIDYWVKP